MSLFNNVREQIKTNKKRRDEGKFNSIPFPFNGLNKMLPGIIKGKYYCISASPGIGKTQLSKFLFVQHPYLWVKDNPQTGIKLKIIYFAHEESKEEFMYSMIASRLRKVDNYDLSMTDLMSMSDKVINEDILKKIDSYSEYFADFESCIDIVDTTTDVLSMYSYVANYMKSVGTLYYKNLKTKEISTSKVDENYVISHYEPNNSNEYVIIVVDHVSLNTIKSGNTHTAMSEWSNVHAKNLTKIYNCVVLDIQQQSADTEKLQFSNKGETVEQKMIPTLAQLADNKLVGRNYMFAAGLFAPDRYNIEYYGKDHKGVEYKIVGSNDHIRFLFNMKNRFGPSGGKIALYFNGKTNEFYQLPIPSELTEEDKKAIANGTYNNVKNN